MTELEKHISTTGEELGTTPYHNVRMAQNLNKVTKDLHEKVNPVKSRILEKLNKLRDSLITVKGCFDKSRSTGYVSKFFHGCHNRSQASVNLAHEHLLT